MKKMSDRLSSSLGAARNVLASWLKESRRVLVGHAAMRLCQGDGIVAHQQAFGLFMKVALKY